MTLAVTHVDFETRSRADLKVVGGRRYAEHPSTRVICAVIKTGDEWIEWHPGLPALFGRHGRARAVCAHNAMNFDRFIWRKLGWPEPERWVDTAELAKVAGYHTAALEGLAEHCLGIEKDMEGNAITLALSKPEQYYTPEAMDLTTAKDAWRAAHPKGCGERLPTAQLKAARVRHLDSMWTWPLDLPRPDVAPVPTETLERVIAYCRKDVEIMAALYDGFLAQWLESDLPGLEHADRALNDRGVCFDRELAALLLGADAALGEAALSEAGVEASIVRSPAQLLSALRGAGYEGAIGDCTADTLAHVLADAKARGQTRVVRLVEARQAVSSIAAGKLRAGLARVAPDGKLRDNRTYMGAHTGRWAGKGFQIDNMAKGL